MVLTRMMYYPVHFRSSLLVLTVPEGSLTRLGSLQLRKLQPLDMLISGEKHTGDDVVYEESNDMGEIDDNHTPQLVEQVSL